MEAENKTKASYDMARAKQNLPGHSLCLCKGDSILKHDGRGISPMMEYLERGIVLCGYSAADVIVGKAAAMLFVKAGIREVYGEVMSEAGAEFLDAHGIPYSYGTLTPKIINRAGTGICPMEEAVTDITDCEKGYKKLILRRKELAAKHAEQLSGESK